MTWGYKERPCGSLPPAWGSEETSGASPPRPCTKERRSCTRSSEDVCELGKVMRGQAQDVDKGAESLGRRGEDRDPPGRRPRDASTEPLRGRRGDGRALIGRARVSRGPARASPGHLPAGRGHRARRNHRNPRCDVAGPLGAPETMRSAPAGVPSPFRWGDGAGPKRLQASCWRSFDVADGDKPISRASLA
jgi:hypothetical protein